MSILILLRHGQSEWNQKNLFTGWVDVPLSSQGIREALEAGEKIKQIPIDSVYCSVLERSMETAMLVLSVHESGKTPVIMQEKRFLRKRSGIWSDKSLQDIIPVHKNWRLNERYYGRLQGNNKKETAEKYGEEQVHIWRRSFDVRPPGGESLKDTSQRTLPFFRKIILSEIQKGRNVLVSAHGNSLRSIIMYLDRLSVEEVLNLELPTGQPVLFEWKDNELTGLKQ